MFKRLLPLLIFLPLPAHAAFTVNNITCPEIMDAWTVVGTGTVAVTVVDPTASFTIPQKSLTIPRESVLGNPMLTIEYPITHPPIPDGVKAEFTAMLTSLPAGISAVDALEEGVTGSTETILNQLIMIGANPGTGTAEVRVSQSNSIIPAAIETVPPAGILPLPFCELCRSAEVSMTTGGHFAEIPPSEMQGPGTMTFGLSHRQNRNNCCGQNQNQTDYRFRTINNPYITFDSRIDNLTPNTQVDVTIDYTPTPGAPPVISEPITVEVLMRGPRAMAQANGTSCPDV